MIGWLAGRVLHQLASGAIILDVGGVGYEVHVASLETTEEYVELFVHTVVRDDAIQLFGFTTIEQREFFELLIATPGVGPSTALGALRTMSVVELAYAIESEDAKKVATIAGIGPKTAARIVLELRGRVTLDAGYQPAGSAAPVDAVIEDALRTLGYTSHEIRDALKDTTLPEPEDAALRTALRLLRRS